MDKLAAMRVFVQVVDSGSFIRASESLGLPKSAVTRQVQALEAVLRVKLLHRTSRRLSLTPQGEQYYQGARILIEQVKRLDDGLTQNSSISGQLRIELPTALACYLVIPWLPEFTSLYPDIQILLSTQNRTSDLIKEQIDCVIRTGPLLNDALVARSLGEIRISAYASPDYLRLAGIPQHPGRLQNHRIIRIASPQTGRPFERALSRDGEFVTLDAVWQLSVNDSAAALSAAESGMGIVLTYDFLTARSVSEGRLVRLFEDWQSEAVPVHAAWPENRHLASRVRIFVEWIRRRFSQ
ncbi:LysR family transcriptional regulator [Pantoea sp. YR343]|uniref:LysR family transcriptional regulator n=1 Tax=Pantoea sp. YR343 TaxID=1144341 RepID=UPI0002714A31|nr:LysR family transcriptional regulator [Pantoea sp. YR343]KAJ9430783.1 LysR family transcriptional regulator [Pantoea sp. YR343]